MPARKRKTSRGAAPSPQFSHAAKLPIQSVVVVGAGGTGSVFLTHLCRIWQAWVKLGGEPFTIELYDDDTVSEANLARQVFCEADIGLPKALVLAQRMQAFFSIPVEARVERYRWAAYKSRPDVVVGCVDTLVARRELHQASQRMEAVRRQWGMDTPETFAGCYWLDMGNTSNQGQVILGGHGLPTFFDVYPELVKKKDRKNEPSCSMAEALARQDLFINSTLATLGGQLLWQAMRHGGLNHHGYIVNLHEGLVLPLRVAKQ